MVPAQNALFGSVCSDSLVPALRSLDAAFLVGGLIERRAAGDE